MRLVVAALLFSAVPAWAQGYFGASVGQSRLDSATDTAARGFAGYQFTPNFSMEGGYQALGSASNNGRSASLSAFDFTFLGAWELGNRYALLGRVGVYRAETSGFGTNLGPMWGAGVSYDLTRNATFRLEWMRYDQLGPDTYPSLDIDVLSIGAVYRF
jgi:opacity protein-like surface antigen